MIGSIEPYSSDTMPSGSPEVVSTVEEESFDETEKFIRDRVNLSFSSSNKMEIIKGVKERFGWEMVEASNLVVSIISDLRVDRARELLKTGTREAVVEQLKKEWGNNEKVKREEAQRIEGILAKVINKAQANQQTTELS